MSEQGWQNFLAAEGVDDWVVLHGGATAVFRVRSLREATHLAEAVSRVPGLDDSGVLLTMADASLTVRLSRDLWQLEPRHVELARPFRRCSSPSRPNAARSSWASGARCSGTRRWLMTMRWTL
jgi:4a-hydroxytetrahydrobiopterin dehydratase